MSNSYGDSQHQDRKFENTREGNRGGYRSGRPQGNREFGGFRIRLSDNEMRSARAIQEAFNLRSTVAVLGFAVRTLGQMLEEGKINDLISQYQTQNPRNVGQREDINGSFASRKNRFEGNKGTIDNNQSKANPFARPEKPQPDKEKVENNKSGESNIDEVKQDQSEQTKTIEESIENQAIKSEEGTKESNVVES